MISKSKIKLSLIDDYVKICIINNFVGGHLTLAEFGLDCANAFKNTQHIGKTLKQTYEMLFEKLKLNNAALLVLKNELNANGELLKYVQNNPLKLPILINKMNCDLNEILAGLKQKLKKLKLNFNAEILC